MKLYSHEPSKRPHKHDNNNRKLRWKMFVRAEKKNPVVSLNHSLFTGNESLRPNDLLSHSTKNELRLSEYLRSRSGVISRHLHSLMRDHQAETWLEKHEYVFRLRRTENVENASDHCVSIVGIAHQKSSSTYMKLKYQIPLSQDVENEMRNSQQN